LGLGHILPVQDLTLPDSCFNNMQCTSMALQLAVYYYAIQGYTQLHSLQTEDQKRGQSVYLFTPTEVWCEVKVFLHHINPFHAASEIYHLETNILYPDYLWHVRSVKRTLSCDLLVCAWSQPFSPSTNWTDVTVYFTNNVSIRRRRILCYFLGFDLNSLSFVLGFL
jgi:hypothetical protein